MTASHLKANGDTCNIFSSTLDDSFGLRSNQMIRLVLLNWSLQITLKGCHLGLRNECTDINLHESTAQHRFSFILNWRYQPRLQSHELNRVDLYQLMQRFNNPSAHSQQASSGQQTHVSWEGRTVTGALVNVRPCPLNQVMHLWLGIYLLPILNESNCPLRDQRVILSPHTALHR